MFGMFAFAASVMLSHSLMSSHVSCGNPEATATTTASVRPQ